MSIFIITGKITSGKTSFLEKIQKKLNKYWKTTGFVSLSDKRVLKSSEISKQYFIKMINREVALPWAIRNAQNTGYDFIDETKRAVESEVFHDIQKNAELVVLDDLGFLEISGKGFDSLLQNIIHNEKLILILSVKKDALNEFLQKYKIENEILIDLDNENEKTASEKLLSNLKIFDSEKLGIYASVAGLTEIGLGSVLHSAQIPLKGHFLAYLQNFLLIIFGKNLRGRGLYSISFISAALKAFSPTGAKLKPMMYIFLQGCAFTLPKSIFGWNLFSVILGSVLMSVFTIAMELGLEYLTFGIAKINSYIAIVSKSLSVLGIHSYGFVDVIILLLSFKIFLALIIAFIAYYASFDKFLFNKIQKVKSLDTKDDVHIKSELPVSLIRSIKGAFRDLTMKGFIVSFIFSILLIFFFSGISKKEIYIIIVRGLVISWFGFLIARNIDFNKILAFLDKNQFSHISNALTFALKNVKRKKEE